MRNLRVGEVVLELERGPAVSYGNHILSFRPPQAEEASSAIGTCYSEVHWKALQRHQLLLELGVQTWSEERAIVPKNRTL